MEVVRDLRENARPVDGVDSRKFVSLVDLWVGEESFYEILVKLAIVPDMLGGLSIPGNRRRFHLLPSYAHLRPTRSSSALPGSG